MFHCYICYHRRRDRSLGLDQSRGAFRFHKIAEIHIISQKTLNDDHYVQILHYAANLGMVVISKLTDELFRSWNHIYELYRRLHL